MVCTYLCCHIPYFCNSAPNWECFPCGEYHFSVRGNISWLVIVSVLLSVSSFCCIVAKEKKIPNHMSILWHSELFITLLCTQQSVACGVLGFTILETAGWIWKYTVCTMDTHTRMYRAYCMFPYLAHWTRLNCQLQLCCCILHASCNRHWKVRVNNQYALSLLTIRYQILSACPPIGIAFPAVLRTQSSGC